MRNIAKTKDSILHILLMLLKGESDDKRASNQNALPRLCWRISPRSDVMRNYRLSIVGASAGLLSPDPAVSGAGHKSRQGSSLGGRGTLPSGQKHGRFLVRTRCTCHSWSKRPSIKGNGRGRCSCGRRYLKKRDRGLPSWASFRGTAAGIVYTENADD